MIKRQTLIEHFPYHMVAVVSPHPDDSCIAAGGILYRLSQELSTRCKTHVLIMTSGARGVTDTYLSGAAADDSFAVLWTSEERERITAALAAKRAGSLRNDDRAFLSRCRAAIRRHEVECEAKVLGFTPHFLDLSIYIEHTLTEADEAKLAAKLAELRVAGPQRLLIMPGQYEQHQTHRLAADLVSKVAQDPSAGEYELWAYESPWSVMMPRPDVVIPLSEEAMRAKIEATRCHKSQIERTPYTRIVEGTAVKTAAVLSEWLGSFDISRAAQLGNYAESFERLTHSVVLE